MWRFPDGEDVFDGPHARFFRYSLAGLWRYLEGIGEVVPDAGLGVAFCELDPSQRLLMLADVGEAVLLKDAMVPPLNCWTEGTFSAILSYAAIGVLIEIESPPDFERSKDAFFWRRLILQAIAEPARAELEANGFLVPQLDSCEVKPWEDLIEDAFDAFTWDNDHELLPKFRKLKAARRTAWLRDHDIAKDYFDPMASVSNEELQLARARLRKLLGDERAELN